MKMKKPVCLIAAALSALLAVPASAARPVGVEGGTTEFTAQGFLPDVEIQVRVPAESKLYINPLSLPVEINGTVENKQIVCETSYIENQSVVPVIVDATVSGAVKEGSDLTLYSVSTQGSTSTAKRAFFYFEMQAVDDPAHVEWAGVYDSAEHIPVKIYARSKKKHRDSGCRRRKRMLWRVPLGRRLHPGAQERVDGGGRRGRHHRVHLPANKENLTV